MYLGCPSRMPRPLPVLAPHAGTRSDGRRTMALLVAAASAAARHAGCQRMPADLALCWRGANALVLQMQPTEGCGQLDRCARRGAAVEPPGAADQERSVLRVVLTVRSIRPAKVAVARVWLPTTQPFDAQLCATYASASASGTTRTPVCKGPHTVF